MLRNLPLAYKGLKISIEISKLATDPIDRILIARKLDIMPEWILESFIELCERKESLSLDDLERFNSIRTVAMISIARERVQTLIRESPIGGELKQACRDIVKEVFGSK